MVVLPALFANALLPSKGHEGADLAHLQAKQLQSSMSWLFSWQHTCGWAGLAGGAGGGLWGGLWGGAELVQD